MKHIITLLLMCCTWATVSAQTLHVGNVSDADDLQSINYDTYRGACAAISAANIRKYAGNDIIGVRFAVGSTAITNVRVFLSDDPMPDKPQNDIASATPTSIEEGWNEVTFATPYTIKGTETELYIGYFFDCSSTDERPILLGKSKHTYGFLLYDYTDDYGWGWYDYSQSHGNLAVQAVIKGDFLPEFDVALTNLFTVGRYAKSDGQLRFSLDIKNNSTQPVPALKLSVYFDGNTELGGEFQLGEIAASNNLIENISLEGYGLKAGRHTLTFSVKEIPGATLTPGTTDDDVVTTSFLVYENEVERQCSLLEVYVNENVNTVPAQTQAIEEMLQAKPNVVPVFLHGDYDGISGEDALAVMTAESYATTFKMRTVPSFVANRVWMTGFDALLTPEAAYTRSAEFLSEMVDFSDELVPAMATLNIDASYDEPSRRVTLTVSGTCVADYPTVFANGCLSVYLTEDSIIGRQQDEEEEHTDYVHNHVLRKVVSGITGDAIPWQSNAFTKEYTFTLDADWDINNMHAIAFIGRKFGRTTDLHEVDVTNAETFSLRTLSPTAISDLEDNENGKAKSSENAWYDLSGRRICASSALHKGLYIINGKKVIK